MIPSHRIASWLLACVKKMLEWLGVDHDKGIEEAVYTIVVCIIAVMLGWLVRHAILFVANRTVALRHSVIGEELRHRHTLSRCSHVITPVFILCLVPFAFDGESHTLDLIMKLSGIYALVAFAVAVNSIFTFIWAHYDEYKNTKRLPLRGVLNVAKGVVWGVVAIISMSVLLGRSPTVLLTGLGAFAAALMLIFRNSILGFVAGIQLAQNDMLRVGDWVVVPSTIANGIVIDVSLSVVKIRNWDNTTVMLPPYTLVTTSFQNWRGMKEVGFRQIMQSILVDASSVRESDEDLLKQVSSRFPVLKDFIVQQQKTGFSDDNLPGGTLTTNLGLYRAYITLYLRNNAHIASEQRMMVRILAQQPSGIPLQIFCYVTTTLWSEFSAIQSIIIEHFVAVAPIFGIRVYNYPDSLQNEPGFPST